MQSKDKKKQAYSVEQRDNKFRLSFKYSSHANLCYRLLASESRRFDHFTVNKPEITYTDEGYKYILDLSWHGRPDSSFVLRDFSKQAMERDIALAKR